MTTITSPCRIADIADFMLCVEINSNVEVRWTDENILYVAREEYGVLNLSQEDMTAVRAELIAQRAVGRMASDI